MKIAIATLKSLSPYSQSRHYSTPEKGEKEGHDEYERRTWRERCHSNEDGYIFIPPMAFKLSMGTAAGMLKIKIKGQGNATYTKHFVSGILVTDPLVLSIKKEDVVGEELFVPADGVPGGGKRVTKIFPRIPSWEGKVTYWVLDETITEPVFLRVLSESGNFVGIGRFRPERRGFYGRFEVVDLKWTDGSEG